MKDYFVFFLTEEKVNKSGEKGEPGEGRCKSSQRGSKPAVSSQAIRKAQGIEEPVEGIGASPDEVAVGSSRRTEVSLDKIAFKL